MKLTENEKKLSAKQKRVIKNIDAEKIAFINKEPYIFSEDATILYDIGFYPWIDIENREKEEINPYFKLDKVTKELSDQCLFMLLELSEIKDLKKILEGFIKIRDAIGSPYFNYIKIVGYHDGITIRTYNDGWDDCDQKIAVLTHIPNLNPIPNDTKREVKLSIDRLLTIVTIATAFDELLIRLDKFDEDNPKCNHFKMKGEDGNLIAYLPGVKDE
jgi:hypothetical protein